MMNLRNDKFEYNKARSKLHQAPYPAIESLLKQLKSNERFKIQEIVYKNYKYPLSRGSNSSLSQRSGSYDKSISNITANTNEDSSNDNDISDKQVAPVTKKSRESKLLGLMSRESKSRKNVYYLTDKYSEKSFPNTEISSFERIILETGTKAPILTSECWAVYDVKNNQFLYGNKENKKREIASLTKIMTCYAVYKLIKEYNVDPKNTYIQVSHMAASMIGTSANLQPGDVLTIWDLLHGMMLPSGNDAAYSLAESFGTYIYLKSAEYKERIKIQPEYANQRHKGNIRYFLNVMNKCAEELNLKNTYYANPHGLINSQNKSTAADVGLLSVAVLKNDLIKQIVSTKRYYCEIEQYNKTIRGVTWENTNKLLENGWNGVKTGITTAAGPCLSASYSDSIGNQYAVVLLCAHSMEHRWEEANEVVKWVIETKKLYQV